MLLTSIGAMLPSSVLPSDLSDVAMYSDHEEDEIDVKHYTMFIDKRNSTAGGDGYLTTSQPDSGEKNESALDATLEFRTRYLLNDMPFVGTFAAGGEANEWESVLNIFLKATASQQQQTATYTFRLLIEDDSGNSQTVATAQNELPACTDLFGCGWNEETIKFRWIGSQTKTIPIGGALVIEASAESTCEAQSGGLFDRCEAEVLWGDPDHSNDYSYLTFMSNAAAGSEVRIYEQGAKWDIDPETNDWYPNADSDERRMEFKVQVINALGREDVHQVKVRLRAPDGSYPVDHIFSNNQLTEDGGVLVASLVWEYPSGIDSGSYELSLTVLDEQGPNPFVFEHDDIIVHQYGVSVTNAAGRNTEYIAPGQVTVVQLVLRHTGADDSSIDVQLEVETTLDGSWGDTFDRPEGYTLQDGGDEVTAQFTLEAPDELGNAPPRIDISIRAKNQSGAEVFYTMYQLSIEKLDVYAPPMLSLWDSDQEVQIYNSTRSEMFDASVPQFVDSMGPPTPFYIELFNTGFDADSFRFEVTDKPRGTVFYFVDNETQQVIQQSTEDGLWHTPVIDHHDTHTIVLYVNPSNEPDDPDYGLMELEFSSAGNSSLSAIVQFTPHRTNGMQAEVVFDCDGASNGLGHVEQENCPNDDADEYIDLRMRVEATQTSGDENQLVDWRIRNPADYERNMEAEEGRYALWDYFITDLEGDPLPMVQLTSGDSFEFWVEIHLTKQVIAANHTVYVRVEEVTEDAESQRFFDLPISIEVKEGKPDLKIVQVSANQPIVPGESTDYTMRLKNEGNTDMQVVLSADSPGGWSADATNPDTQSSLVLVPAFSEVTFNLKVSSDSSARHGDFYTITITGEPQSFETAFTEEDNAEAEIEVRVEINDPVMRVSNELTNMRLETQLLLAGIVLLAVIGFKGRRGSDDWDEDDEYHYDEEDVEEEFDLPVPVVDEDSGEEVEEDLDDIELLDE